MDACGRTKAHQRVSCSFAPIGSEIEKELPVRISWSVASYRDNQLASTLLSAFHFAHFPSRLFPVVLWQGELQAPCCLCRTAKVPETGPGTGGKETNFTKADAEESSTSFPHCQTKCTKSVSDVAQVEKGDAHQGKRSQRNNTLESSEVDEENGDAVESVSTDGYRGHGKEPLTSSKSGREGTAAAPDTRFEPVSRSVSSCAQKQRRLDGCHCWCHTFKETVSSFASQSNLLEAHPVGRDSRHPRAADSAEGRDGQSASYERIWRWQVERGKRLTERKETAKYFLVPCDNASETKPPAVEPNPATAVGEPPTKSNLNEESFDLWELALFIWRRRIGADASLSHRQRILARKKRGGKHFPNTSAFSGENACDIKRVCGEKQNEGTQRRKTSLGAPEMSERDTREAQPTQPHPQTAQERNGRASASLSSFSASFPDSVTTALPMLPPGFSLSLKRVAMRQIIDLLPRWLQMSLLARKPPFSLDVTEGVEESHDEEDAHEAATARHLPLRCYLLSVVLPALPSEEDKARFSFVVEDSRKGEDQDIGQQTRQREHKQETAHQLLRIPVLELLMPKIKERRTTSRIDATSRAPVSSCSSTSFESSVHAPSWRPPLSRSSPLPASSPSESEVPPASKQVSEREDIRRASGKGEEEDVDAPDRGDDRRSVRIEEEAREDEEEDERACMRIAFLDWRESRGPCLARAICEWLLPVSPSREARTSGEETRLELFLQTDSHMRFAPHFDCFLLRQLKLAAALSAERRRAQASSQSTHSSFSPHRGASSSGTSFDLLRSACSSLLLTEKVILTGYPPGYEEGTPFFEYPRPPQTSGQEAFSSFSNCLSEACAAPSLISLLPPAQTLSSLPPVSSSTSSSFASSACLSSSTSSSSASSAFPTSTSSFSSSPSSSSTSYLSPFTSSASSSSPTLTSCFTASSCDSWCSSSEAERSGVVDGPATLCPQQVCSSSSAEVSPVARGIQDSRDLVLPLQAKINEGKEKKILTVGRDETGEGEKNAEYETLNEIPRLSFPETYFPGILLCAGHFDRNGLLRTKGRMLRVPGPTLKAACMGSGGAGQGSTRKEHIIDDGCSSLLASSPPIPSPSTSLSCASSSFSDASTVPLSFPSSESSGLGVDARDVPEKTTHRLNQVTACSCPCLHCCGFAEAACGASEGGPSKPAESAPPSFLASSDLSAARSSPSFFAPPSSSGSLNCFRPLESLFWAAGFSFGPARVTREVGYDPRLHFVFFGEEQTMTLRLFTHGWSFYAPRFSVVFHLWTRARRPFFKADLFRLLSEDGDKRNERTTGRKRRCTQQAKSVLSAHVPLHKTRDTTETDSWRTVHENETGDTPTTTRDIREETLPRPIDAALCFSHVAVSKSPLCPSQSASFTGELPTPAPPLSSPSSSSLSLFFPPRLSSSSSRPSLAEMLSPGEARVHRILSATAESTTAADLCSLGLGSQRRPESFWREIDVDAAKKVISRRARNGGYSEDIFQVTAEEHRAQREGVQLLLSLLTERKKDM
ncbi:putative glycosyltransferase [Toxoplasma gondii TgCatPRC2]|uniref:Putative glycosyltransferase n=1 Tax=Toxoplasma gondii TgCatPRC2 TaxID=1130821 RepID=A0A151H8D7_TOXGO|nr:putative glycosyltransferase [Toxoplasma gondii TgCatPRC2]